MYWCLPHADDERRFQKVIDALAKAQGAPSFQPHLTLGSLFKIEDPPQLDIPAEKEIVLAPLGIDGNEVFTTSLFVRFGVSEALKTARAMLERQSSFRQGRAFDPHMSLCYGPPPKGARTSKDVQALLANPVRFDRIATVSVELPVNSYDGVRAWKVLKIVSI